MDNLISEHNGVWPRKAYKYFWLSVVVIINQQLEVAPEVKTSACTLQSKINVSFRGVEGTRPPP